MKISDVRVRKINSEGKMKAIVSVTFDDCFVVHDIKIIEGQEGLFIACLLYTSDDADDLLCVVLGGRRIIKKKKNTLQLPTFHPPQSSTYSMLSPVLLCFIGTSNGQHFHRAITRLNL